MATLAECCKRQKTFVSMLRVHIIAQGKPRQYALADDSTSIECTVYDETKIKKMAIDTSVVIINGTMKHNPRPHLEIGKSTRITKTGTIDVPEHIRKEAMELVNPQPADFINIAEVQTSPLKKIVSVKGRVVSEQSMQVVQSKGHDILLKNITIKSSAASCRLSLWRDQAESSITVGDFLQVTNVVTSEWNNEKYLSSTRNSHITKLDKIAEDTQIIGYECTDHETVQLTTAQENFPSYNVCKNLLQESLDIDSDEDIDDALASKVPFDCHLVFDTNGIQSLTVL